MSIPAAKACDGQSLIWPAFRHTLPTALTLVPICMLLGVLAAQANWSVLEVFLFSLLGFSGSGQFALLPLAQQGLGFGTLLLVAVSINSRYIPIAFATSSRLPHTPPGRAALAHVLGDEAYALEHERDPLARIVTIRLTIYGVWVASTVAGTIAAGFIPKQVLGSGVNLGFPASVVLLVLSFGQLKARIPQIDASWRQRCLEVGLCLAVALGLLAALGAVWFWLPSIAFSTWRIWRVRA
jgi:predicted branched-subunit amino acid permease